MSDGRRENSLAGRFKAFREFVASAALEETLYLHQMDRLSPVRIDEMFGRLYAVSSDFFAFGPGPGWNIVLVRSGSVGVAVSSRVEGLGDRYVRFVFGMIDRPGSVIEHPFHVDEIDRTLVAIDR